MSQQIFGPRIHTTEKVEHCYSCRVSLILSWWIMGYSGIWNVPKLQGVTMRMQQFLITAAVALAVVLGVQHYQRTKA